MSSLAPTAMPKRLKTYAWLAKVDVPDLWLGIPLAWSLLEPGVRTQPRTLVLILLCVVAVVGGSAGAVALDDVQGTRDGSDAINYSRAQAAPRKRYRKPLLDGALAEGQALRFGVAAGVLSLAAQVAAAAIVGFRPLWLVVAAPVLSLAVLQYSFGLKLSYLVTGAGELTLATGQASTVLFPYALVTGGVTDAVAAESAVLGLWMVLIAMCSNTHDAAGDRRAGRATIAARTPPLFNRVAIATTFGAAFLVAAGGLWLGLLSPRLLLVFVPVWLLQLRLLYVGVSRNEWLTSRSLGFLAFRVGVAGLFVLQALA
ncbi:MAG: UbiA family prenyltransferase [Actinomycetota bacterium]|nr:UbiA family prenyltransferase [Actinomycetota bacterium]